MTSIEYQNLILVFLIFQIKNYLYIVKLIIYYYKACEIL